MTRQRRGWRRGERRKWWRGIWRRESDMSLTTTLGQRRGENLHALIKKHAAAHAYHWWEFLTGIIPHFEKCHPWGASLWIILIEEIQLCVWVCVQTGGGVGIVCHQMNSWGETNEKCREKEGGILIGLSLFVSLLSLLFSGRTARRLNVGFTEVRRDF